LLDGLSGVPRSAHLQALRGVEALEYIGTQEAQALLHQLAAGLPDAPLTAEVQQSLARLQGPPIARTK
jgi:hypothetical protein